ncbi:MAG: hypothetical protein P4K93_08125, partial [Terracidiphilus sp.]|nr:hypothetical protein [Terracidiphilus sp.]
MRKQILALAIPLIFARDVEMDGTRMQYVDGESIMSRRPNLCARRTGGFAQHKARLVLEVGFLG